MDMDDVESALKKVLPILGAAATGGVPALVAAAAAAVSGALGAPVAASGAAISAAVAGATPEQLLALKTAENQFQLDMQKLKGDQAFAADNLEFQDVAGARARDVDLMKTTGHTNKRANIMLGFVVLGLVALVTMMAVMHISADTALGGVVFMLIGKLIANWDSAFSFEFGTTRSSKTKDETISAALTKK